MPSSLTRVLSSAFGYSPRPPVSVYGTDTLNAHKRGFSRKYGINEFAKRGSTSLLGVNETPDLPRISPYGLVRTFLIVRSPSLLRPPAAQTRTRWYRNINLLSIDYAFRPRLRFRLTLGGITFPRKPWAYGEEDSHFFYRYSFRHNHFHVVQVSLRSPFNLAWNAPLPLVELASSTNPWLR